MLEKGYTRAYVNFPNILKEDKEILLDCERIAQENNVGMWK
jgi:endonuclease YncB( thermonuclease family)